LLMNKPKFENKRGTLRELLSVGLRKEKSGNNAEKTGPFLGNSLVERDGAFGGGNRAR